MASTRIKGSAYVERLRKAIEEGNVQSIYVLLAPDDLNTLPNWDKEPTEIREEFEQLLKFINL